MIRRLREHTIVCGSGETSLIICEQLIEDGKDVVIVSDNAEELAVVRSRFPHCPIVELPCADEFSLAEANLVSAKSVVATTDSDTENLLIAITCKDMGHGLYVAAVCNDITIANRMRKAGVDDVVCPNRLVGNSIVSGLPESAHTRQL